MEKKYSNRKTKMISFLIIGSILIASFVPTIHSRELFSRATIYVDDNADSGWYDATHVRTIQEGIDNATSGDTVYIFNGTYYENVLINKTVIVLGENKTTTILDGGGNGDVIKITANNVTIQNVTVKNAGNLPLSHSGILINSDNNTIYNTIVKNNQIYGINILSCSGNIVMNNSIQNNGEGIRLYSTTLNNISMNVIRNNYYGLRNWYSSHNTIYQNTIELNLDYGIFDNGCQQTTIKKNHISDAVYGIRFWSATLFDINENMIIDNSYGIYLNTDSHNNSIYNNYFDNTNNVDDNGVDNLYNISSVNGTNIIGGPFIGGNYWNDYIGYDNTGDGFGDINIPHPPGDYLPLITENSPPVANFTYTPTNLTMLDLVIFNDTSTDPQGPSDIVYWSWDFGDGNTSYLQHPTYQFGDNGTYNVSLTVTDQQGVSDSITKTLVLLNVAPLASFTYSPSNPDTTQIISFNSTSVDLDGIIVNWSWDLGDGNWAYGENVTNSYTNGSYMVFLHIIDDDGAYNVTSQLITVFNYRPAVHFSFYPSNPSTADIISFIDNSTDRNSRSIVNWTWDFGDNSTSYIQNPTHQYAHSGDYNVTLTIRDNDGATNATTKVVPVTNIGPIANFSYTPAIPTTADVISFNDTSIDSDGTIVNWTWDFGDNTTDYTQHPTHQYIDNGTYIVTLRVLDDVGASDTISKNVTVGNVAPVANFSFIKLNATIDDIFEFNDSSTDSDGVVVSWLWDFGDGNTSTLQHPTHQYINTGIFSITYNVTLTVTDDDGFTNSTIQQTAVINLAPIANFTFLPTSGSTADLISFNETSSDTDGIVVNWTWDFGDGQGSYIQDPNHQYAHSGNYTVILTVVDNDAATYVISHIVPITNIGPVANFSYTPTYPSSADPVSFTDLSTDSDGTIVNWTWDFNDGNMSYDQHPQHRFGNDGTYNVTLTITDDVGASDSITLVITVSNAHPTPNFTWTPLHPTTQDMIQFIDLSSDRSIVSWNWNFGDGNLSSLRNPQHNYPQNGVYNVTLYVSDDDGAINSISKFVTVSNVAPIADYNYTPTTITTADLITFQDTSSDVDGTIVNWSWDFGDGNTSYDQHPTHQYADDGLYAVTLTVIDDDADSNTTVQMILVGNVGPNANFSFSDNNITVEDDYIFTDLSTDSDGIIVNWTWDFGDGNISYDQHPSHLYINHGVFNITYNVTLIVIDDDGAADTIVQQITVTNIAPVANYSYAPLSPTTADTVTFTDTSIDIDGNIVSWYWDFDDGYFNTNQNPTHTFDDGTYNVSLLVTDNDGATHSIIKQVIISNINPIASFTYTPLDPSIVDMIDFTDTSIDPDGTIVNWSWDFGDGNTSYDQHPSHSFAVAGNYTVTLTVTDEDVGSNSTTVVIQVDPFPACFDEIWVDDDYNATVWGWQATHYDSIQDAVNMLCNNGTIYVAEGIYYETLNLLDKSLTIEAAGIDSTIINASLLTGYAIQNFANHTTIRNLTLIGTDHYGFKVSGAMNIILDHIKVVSSGRTGIDLNGVHDAILSDITVLDTVSGFGLMILDSTNIAVNDITTAGNAWGGVTVQTYGAYYPGGTDNIVFSGAFNAAEPAPLLLEQDPPYYPITNVTIPTQFNYVVYGLRSGPDYKQWFYQETLTNAKSIANALMISGFTYVDMLIYDIAKANYHVIPGMLIQDAVDDATVATIHIDPGTYDEQLNISKTLTILGSGSGSTIITNTTTLADSFTTSASNYPIIYVHDIDGVVIQNLTVDGAGNGNANYRYVGIGIHQAGASLYNLDVINVRDTPFSGSQHGVGIYAWSDGTGVPHTINIDNCQVYDYQKTGITLGGSDLTISVTGSIVTGAGPTTVTAQNGIQMGYGATGSIIGNVVQNCSYTGGSWAASGILPINTNGPLEISNNTLFENQVNIYVANCSLEMNDNDVYATSSGVGGVYYYGIIGDPGNPEIIPDPSPIIEQTVQTKRRVMLTMSCHGNTVISDGSPNCTAIGVYAGMYGTYDIDFTAEYNTIDNWEIGFELYAYAPNNLSSAEIHYNNIIDTDYGVYNWLTNTYDATCNWWGDASGPYNVSTNPSGTGSIVTSNMMITPWLDRMYPDGDCIGGLCADPIYVDDDASAGWYDWEHVSSVQTAIDRVCTGGTIYISPGIYIEHVTVDKYLHMIGSGSNANGTIITQDATGAGDSHIGIIQLEASGISPTQQMLFEGIRLEPVNIAGISIGRFTEHAGTDVFYVKLDDIKVIGTNTNPSSEQERGLYVDLNSSLQYLEVYDSSFDNLTYGWYLHKEVSNDTSTVQYVNVSDTTFNHNNLKGIYAEKLSDAAFIRCTIDKNGFSSVGVPSHFLPWMAGIDINLKAGDYKNILFEDCTFTDNALGGAREGVGLTVKERGTGTNPSGSYTTFPAHVDDVTVLSCTFTGNERGMRFGEPGKGNVGPTNITVEYTNIYDNIQNYTGIDGSAYGGLINVMQSEVIATCNWWGNVTGPYNASVYPYGSGEPFYGNVLFYPWLTDLYPYGDCDGYPNAPPSVDFTYLPLYPTTADIVYFTDTSTDDDMIVNWTWDFGDGSSSYDQHPSHLYVDDGVYNVTLTIIDNDNATNTTTKSITILNAHPYPDFTWNPTVPTTQDIVQFTDLSTDRSVVDWYWEFGTGYSASVQHPTYQYPDDGVYNVTLTVTDDDGDSNSTTKQITIVNIDPVSSFTIEPVDPEVEQIVYLNDTSSDIDGTIVNWSWDFGDGNTSYDQHTTHQYTEPGNYSVCLTVMDNDGATDISCAYILVISLEELMDVNQSVFDRGFPIRHAADGDWAAAQNFTPTLDTISSVQLYMRKFGNPEFNLTVELRQGSIDGPLLDTLIFDPSEIDAAWYWNIIDFSDTAVIPGEDYFIVCPPAPSGVTTSFGYEWGYAFGNQYDGGSFWFTRDGGVLWRDLPSSYEFTFKTFGIET